MLGIIALSAPAIGVIIIVVVCITLAIILVAKVNKPENIEYIDYDMRRTNLMASINHKMSLLGRKFVEKDLTPEATKKYEKARNKYEQFNAAAYDNESDAMTLYFQYLLVANLLDQSNNLLGHDAMTNWNNTALPDDFSEHISAEDYAEAAVLESANESLPEDNSDNSQSYNNEDEESSRMIYVSNADENQNIDNDNNDSYSSDSDFGGDGGDGGGGGD